MLSRGLQTSGAVAPGGHPAVIICIVSRSQNTISINTECLLCSFARNNGDDTEMTLSACGVHYDETVQGGAAGPYMQ